MKKFVLFISLIIIIFVTIVIVPTYITTHKEIKTITTIDTTYNVVIKDSIEYNIIKRDSIIYNLKQQMIHDIEESKHINDSDAVKLFYKLTSTR